MDCPQANILISGKLDGELTVEQERELNEHLKTCEKCRIEYDEMKKLKEVTEKMQFADLPDKHWAGYWNGVYNNIERGIGWTLFSAGAIILVCIGLWGMLNEFFLNDSVPLLHRFGVGALLAGGVVLLVSILRERLFARKNERYDEVER